MGRTGFSAKGLTCFNEKGVKARPLAFQNTSAFPRTVTPPQGVAGRNDGYPHGAARAGAGPARHGYGLRTGWWLLAMLVGLGLWALIIGAAIALLR